MSEPEREEKEIVDAATVVAEGVTAELAPRTLATVLADRYEIEGLLGSGGMGAVYRVRDRELDEPVALKMLDRSLVASPAMLDRFRQEVKLARRVTHRNVARMFDIGEHDGEKFLTMELVEGDSLGAVAARERPMKIHRVVKIVEDVCAGLSAAHAVGVVHRDLKPENVLIAKDGRVVITDFGIARLSTGDGSKTMGAPIGTPAYMAPEQVEGSKDIDARADIYALGAMLYELLTGERAWQGESVYQVAALRLVMPPPNPRERRPDLPEPVARIVRKCMARNRDERYASADAVAAELSAVTLPAPTMTSSPGAVQVRAHSPGSATPTTGPDTKSVAVLPLRNAGTADDEYLADGLTDDLIDTLSMGKGLRVRSRGAVMRFKGAERDPREVGRELDVQVVADGSVRRTGDQLRVSVRLVSVADGFQIWAKRFDRPISAVLEIGDEAAGAIAEALMVSMSPPPRSAPTDPLALDFYLRARHQYHQMWRDTNNRAIALFEQALARAPEDPQILTGMAMALCRRFAFDESAEESAERALALAQKALEIDPTRGEPRVAIASIRFNFGESKLAAAELRRALDATPQSADANELAGRILCEAGRPEDGIARLYAAMALEPGLDGAKFDIARARALLGDWEESDSFFKRLPEDSLANMYWIARWRLVMWRRDVKQAESLLRLLPDMSFGIKHAAIGMFGVTLHKSISPEALLELDQRAKVGRALRRRAFFRQMKAEVLAYLGDEAGMLDSLEESAQAGLFDITWLERCPLFDGRRDSPRFAKVREIVQARASEVLEALTVPTR